MLPTVYLAAEDVPGLAVGRKLVAERPGLTIYREDNAHGSGGLKKKISNFDQMGKNGFPVLLLTDLDTDPCPSSRVNSWLGHTPSRGFLFRVCVREVEAWLLADHEAIGAFLNVTRSMLPREPELLADPKAKLIQLAKTAPRKIRVGLTPFGRAAIGPDYNELLAEFIAQKWSIDRAVEHAPSLVRARRRIGELATPVTT